MSNNILLFRKLILLAVCSVFIITACKKNKEQPDPTFDNSIHTGRKNWHRHYSSMTVLYDSSKHQYVTTDSVDMMLAYTTYEVAIDTSFKLPYDYLINNDTVYYRMYSFASGNYIIRYFNYKKDSAYTADNSEVYFATGTGIKTANSEQWTF